jgi:hypothetical protein
VKSRSWRWTAVVASAGALALPAVASAQEAAVSAPRPTTRFEEDPVSARMMALGGRAEAISSSTSALFGNPAMAAATRVYHVDGLTLWDPTINRWQFGSVALDSSRQYFAAGLAYNYNTTGNANEQRSTHDARIVAAIPLSTYFGFGAGVRYLNVSYSPPSLEGSKLKSEPWSGFTFDAGVFVRPAQFLVLSASGHNLNNPDTTSAPINMDMSVAAIPFPSLTLVADVLLDFRSADVMRGRYSGGAELFIANHYAFRAATCTTTSAAARSPSRRAWAT